MASVARHERTSFLRIVEEPIAGKASLYYCLPLPDGTAQSYREFLRIPLEAPPWSPGERPFWADVVTSPIAIEPNAPFPHLRIWSHYAQTPLYAGDAILLVVDRNVVVGDLEPALLQRSGERYTVSPEIVFRRLHHRQQIPQSAEADFGFLQAQRTVVRDLTSVRQSGLRVGTNQLIVSESPRSDGGVSIRFIVHFAMDPSARPHGGTEFDWVVAEVVLAPTNPGARSAWYYKISPRQERYGRYRAEFVYSPTNLAVTVKTRPNDLYEIFSNFDLSAELRSWVAEDIPYVDIRFKQVGIDMVPRAGENVTIQGTHSHSHPANLRAGVRIVPRVEEGRTIARALLDLSLGAIPYVGDIIDIGELALGVTTGRDRYGERVTTEGLVLSGLGAILPLVSGPAIRRAAQGIDEIATTTRAIRQRWRSVAAFVEHYRPTLLRRIRAGGGLIDLGIGAGETIARASEATFARVLSSVTSMTGVRDPRLARLLDIEPPS